MFLLNSLCDQNVTIGDDWYSALINVVFHRCLFEIPFSQVAGVIPPPICKTDYTRGAAFSLLAKLAGMSIGNYLLVVDLLEKMIPMECDEWKYTPAKESKCKEGYVGLRNLGATCYMNSIMQQFYLNPAFRSGVLRPVINENEKEDNVLWQMQAIFANLQESEMRSYDASDFFEAYKDWDGNSVNVGVQMDIDEFFSMLFDKLEGLLSGRAEKNLLKDVYGGVLVQKIESKDCEHTSERDEGFFSIQCEVKDKKNIYESLQLYVEGEALDGENKYHCGECDGKVSAMKRTCIKELPKSLIVHLKRFDYDRDSMQRVKLNDRFEFPLMLDMRPYLDTYVSAGSGDMTPSGDLYRLNGIIVHSGTADSGHYYSYISDGKGRWFHFNDSNVEGFDAGLIPNACFGGVDEINTWDASEGRMVTKGFKKNYSAYMLFYERVSDDERSGVVSIPMEIKTGIWRDNQVFMHERNVFNEQFLSFVWGIVNDARKLHGGNEVAVKTFQFSLEFCVFVVFHWSEVDYLRKWIGVVNDTIKEKMGDGCQPLLLPLLERKSVLREVLLKCWVGEVREGLMKLLGTVLDFVEDVRGDATDWAAFKVERGLIDLLMELLSEAHIYWGNFDELFMVLAKAIKVDACLVGYVIERGYFSRLLDFYLVWSCANV